MRCGRHEEGDGEEGDGHEAPPRHEEEGRAGGGADEGDTEKVSPSWALTSKGRVSWRRIADRFVDSHVQARSLALGV